MTPLFTPDDLADAERALSALLRLHAEETDPGWRDAYAEQIADETRWLAEMREAVAPELPLLLPIGLRAPQPHTQRNTR